MPPVWSKPLRRGVMQCGSCAAFFQDDEVHRCRRPNVNSDRSHLRWVGIVQRVVRLRSCARMTLVQAAYEAWDVEVYKSTMPALHPVFKHKLGSRLWNHLVQEQVQWGPGQDMLDREALWVLCTHGTLEFGLGTVRGCAV